MSDALDKINRVIQNTLQPHGNIDLIEWIKNNCYVVNSPKGDKVNLNLTPYFIEPFLQIMKNPKLVECNICSPVGSGKSTMMLALVTACTALYPKQLMIVGQNEAQTTDFLDLLVKPAMKKNPIIKRMWPKRQLDRKESIHFPTHSIYTGYATAINTLQSRSIDLLLCDESWLYPTGIISEARGRLHSRPGARMVNVSQGSFLNDEFHRNYSLGLVKQYAWKCPNCEQHNIYKFEDLKFDYEKDAEDVPLYNTVLAYLQCPKCEHKINDTISNRRKLSENGLYITEDEKQNHMPNHVSYNFNQLSVYDVEWSGLAREFLAANNSLNRKGAIRSFFQKKMGEFFDESSLAEQVDLSDNLLEYSMDQYKDDPWECRLMSVDVQMDRMYVCVRDWTKTGSSRLVAYRYCTTFADVERLRNEYGVKSKAVFVDIAYRPEEGKTALAQYNFIGLNGREDRLFTVTNKAGKRVMRVWSAPKLADIKTEKGLKRVQIIHYAGTSCKDILSTIMAKTDRWLLPNSGETFDNYMHQLLSESREIDQKTGKPYYKKRKDQNHAWDTEVMQIVGAMIWGCVVYSEEEISENE